MIPLVVLDPALGRTGAHNLAFAGMLADLEPGQAIGICGNVAMGPGLRQRLARRCEFVEPAFDLDFYALARQPGSAPDHWDWIHRLAGAYMKAMERALARWPDRQVRVLHHTLSWEHANALALAIGMLGSHGDRLQHLALLMYPPGVDPTGATLDPQRRLNFRIAFGALRRTGRVALYAGCLEHAEAYRHLLELPAPLPLHPCFMADWRGPRPVADPARQDVIMYLGEIKQEKGFLDLPRRLRRELELAGPTRRFILQFAAVRTGAARAVLSELRAIADAHPNVEIHEGFWSHARLSDALASASILRLDYDPWAYRHKSSGLLWLAAWYRLAVCVPADTWLEREARRLGVAVLPGAGPALAAHARIDELAEDKAYFRELFTPFFDWLANLPTPWGEPPPSPAARALASRPAVGPVTGPGVDVVLFWKQNDSTLYGRRSDMVARYLATRPDVRRVLVLDAPIAEDRLATLAASTDGIRHDHWIAERTLEKLEGRHDGERLAHSVFVHPRDGFAPDEQDRPGPAFLHAYERFLRREFEHWGIDPGRALFWIYPRNFSLQPLLARLSPARVVLDIVDDHRAWPGQAPEEVSRLGDHYRELMAAADLVLVNCQPVEESMSALGGRPVLVPNGCDAPLPVDVADLDDALRDHLAFPGRVLGFVGNLEAKIDIGLLSRLAETYPDARLVLIGSTHANPEVASLRRHANVRLTGVVPYDRLGAWLSRFDVGLIPHRQMELTRYMNPLKAYVYLANGVPVVSTNVPNVEVVPGLLTVAADEDGFIAAVAECLAAPRPSPDRFRAAAAPHGWAARLGPHVDALGLVAGAASSP